MSKARQLAQKPTQPTGRKNLIINGAMNVAQRSDEVTGITSGSGTTAYRTVDRIRFEPGSLGTWTVSQETDAPAGFSNSFKVLCTVADASPSANDYLLLAHTKLEAQNLGHLEFGTSGAKDLTLSFWVKSNKTGNASVNLLNAGTTRTTHPQYTINAADTWEYKTITVSGDTAQSLSGGLEVLFWGNSGSTFTGGSHRTTFGTRVNADRNVSNLGVGGAINDYWQITGLQLEAGSVATEFEHRSFGEELALCQRYFRTSKASAAYNYILPAMSVESSNTGHVAYDYRGMRTSPTVTSSGGIQGENAGGTLTFTGAALVGSNFMRVSFSLGTASTGGTVTHIRDSGSGNAKFEFNSEL